MREIQKKEAAARRFEFECVYVTLVRKSGSAKFADRIFADRNFADHFKKFADRKFADH